jgi:hypothetical protein
VRVELTPLFVQSDGEPSDGLGARFRLESQVAGGVVLPSERIRK